MTKLGNIDTSTDTPLGEVSLGDPVGSLSRVMVGGFGLAMGLGLAGFAYSKAKSSFESATGIDAGEGFVQEV